MYGILAGSFFISPVLLTLASVSQSKEISDSHGIEFVGINSLPCGM
jgi:hypothetical protein